jgi:hypothetical protein
MNVTYGSVKNTKGDLLMNTEVNTEIVPTEAGEIVAIDQNGSPEATVYSTDLSPDSEILVTYDAPDPQEAVEATEDTLRDVQAQVTRFLENLPDHLSAFFNNNRQAINNVGLIILAFLGVRVLFAVLDAIDDIPLMAFALKVTGLVYVIQFVWRYLMRASDRARLAQKIEQVKTELLGSEQL